MWVCDFRVWKIEFIEGKKFPHVLVKKVAQYVFLWYLLGKKATRNYDFKNRKETKSENVASFFLNRLQFKSLEA